jgi:hypothetical protein
MGEKKLIFLVRAGAQTLKVLKTFKVWQTLRVLKTLKVWRACAHLRARDKKITCYDDTARQLRKEPP